MIVIEGAPRTGKTSLASALCFRTGWPVLRFNRETTLSQCLEALADNPRPFIADQFYLTRLVYGEALVSERPRLRRLQDEMIRRGALLVLLHDALAVIAERVRVEGEARVDALPGVVSRFDEEWSRSRVARARFCYGESPDARGEVEDAIVRLVTGVER